MSLPRESSLFANKPGIQYNIIDYLHPKIKLSDLKQNGKLISDDMINYVIEYFHSEPTVTRTQVTEENTSYHVIKLVHPDKNITNYYAVYFGKKKDAQIGEGGAGTLRLMQDIQSGEWAILKSYRIEEAGQESGRHSYAELPDRESVLEMLANVKRVSLAKGHIERQIKPKEDWYPPEKSKFYKISAGMPLFNGINVATLIKHADEYPNLDWLEIIVTILAEFKKLHAQDLLHGDVKPANILYDIVTNVVSLIDFDNTHSVEEFKNGSNTYTTGYSSHELSYTAKSEVFSLGITIGKMLGLTEDDTVYKNGWVYPLCKTDSERFKANTQIKNPEQRARILAFLERMTDSDEKIRPDLAEVISFFTNIFYEYLNSTNAARRIGLINLSEYKAIKSDATKSKLLIDTLKAMNEVWMIDTKQEYVKEYQFLIREFMNAKINIRNIVWHSEDKQASCYNVLGGIAERAPSQNSLLPNAYFFATTQLVPEEINTALLQKRIKVLNAQEGAEPIQQQITQYVAKHSLIEAQFFYVRCTLEHKIEDLSRRYADNPIAKTKIVNIKTMLSMLEILTKNRELTHDRLREALIQLQPTVLKTSVQLLSFLDRNGSNNDQTHDLPARLV